METIISAIISAGAAIVVCAISRIKQLESKVDLHNNAVERLYEVERQLGIDEEKIRSNQHRIDDLEQYHK